MGSGASKKKKETPPTSTASTGNGNPQNKPLAQFRVPKLSDISKVKGV